MGFDISFHPVPWALLEETINPWILGERPDDALDALVADGVRLARGKIEATEFAERMGGNAVGMAGAAGGAYVGSFVGTLAMPVIGTAVGSVIGGVIGGVGGDTYGRRKVRNVLGVDDYDDEDWDDWDDED